MDHVDVFPPHHGTPAFRRVSSLEEAVRLVEHLRNVENVAELSVHALTEVPLAFKAVYRVEVPGAAVVEVPAQELPPPLPVMEPVLEPVLPPVMAPVMDSIPTVVPDGAPEAVLEVVPDAAPELAPESEAVPALAAQNGHSAEAPSSLGFFAS
jgi:hypothetical protein